MLSHPPEPASRRKFQSGFCILALLLCGAFARPLFGQFKNPLPRFNAESIQAQTRIKAIEDSVRFGQGLDAIAMLVGACEPGSNLAAVAGLQVLDEETWERALTECIELTRELGDGLVPEEDVSPLTTVGPPFLSVRRRLAVVVSQWPPSMRRKYQQQVAARAKDLLEQGLAKRSPRLVQRLVDEVFASASADQALVWLGDLAFFHGDFHGALAWWSLLSPLPSEAASEERSPLRHADAGVDFPLLGTKQALAVLYLGRIRDAKRERDALDKLHPSAKVTLGDARGTPAELLDRFMARGLKDGDPFLREDWPTLGGSPTRHAVVPYCPPARLWLDGPTWKVPLPALPKKARKEADDPLPAPRRPLYHPVILGDRVVLVNSQSVSVYHLHTGEQVFHQVWPAATTTPSPETPAYTASGERDFVVFRIGESPDRDEHVKKPMETTWLIGLDLRPDAEKGKRVRWEVSVPVANVEDGFFSGPPLIHQGRVWAPYQQWQGARLVHGVASLNPETGRWLTKTLVCDAPPVSRGREGPRQPVLLSGAGNLIVCCTQSGVIAALDSQTGQVVWGVRYATQGPWTRLTTPSVRDLAAPLYALGRVYVAPQDTDLLFCLDGHTGRVLWEREALDIVQLLACADGKLIFTTATGLRAIDARTGSDGGGWLRPEIGKLGSLGRGLVLGGWVIWPTVDPRLPMRGLTALGGDMELSNAGPGEPQFLSATMLHHLGAGNVVYGRGCLLVAGEKELTAFVRPRFLLDARRERRAKEHSELSDYLLALAEADAGLRADAVARLEKVIAAGADLWAPLAQNRLGDLRREWGEEELTTAKAEEHFGGVSRKIAKERIETVAIKAPLREAFRMEGNLTPLERVRPESGDDSVIVWRQGKAICVDAASGKTRWQVAWPDRLVWVGMTEEHVFLGGPDQIQGLTKTGKEGWILRNPSRRWDRRVLDGKTPVFLEEPGALGAFSLTDWFLFFGHDRRRLFMLYQELHRPRLILGAPRTLSASEDDGAIPGPMATFANQALTWDGAGNLIRIKETEFPEVAVTRTPFEAAGDVAPLDAGRVLLSQPRGQVALWDLDARKERWRYTPESSPSLTGKAAKVVVLGAAKPQAVLAVVPRNLGDDLICLDAETGKLLWQRDHADVPQSFPLGSVSHDASRVYVGEGNSVRALDVTTGKDAWQEKLPIAAAGWKTLCHGGLLIVHPRGEARVLPAALRPFPALGVAWQTANPIAKDDAEVFLLEPVHGRVLQRIKMERGPGPYLVQTCGSGLVIGNGWQVTGFVSSP